MNLHIIGYGFLLAASWLSLAVWPSLDLSTPIDSAAMVSDVGGASPAEERASAPPILRHPNRPPDITATGHISQLRPDLPHHPLCAGENLEPLPPPVTGSLWVTGDITPFPNSLIRAGSHATFTYNPAFEFEFEHNTWHQFIGDTQTEYTFVQNGTVQQSGNSTTFMQSYPNIGAFPTIAKVNYKATRAFIRAQNCLNCHPFGLYSTRLNVCTLTFGPKTFSSSTTTLWVYDLVGISVPGSTLLPNPDDPDLQERYIEAADEEQWLTVEAVVQPNIPDHLRGQLPVMFYSLHARWAGYWQAELDMSVPRTYLLTATCQTNTIMQMKLHVVRAKIIKPHGNPKLSPPDPDDLSGANETNELVYNEIPIVPTLTVDCQAASTPLADRLRWEITGIPDAALSWTNQEPHEAIANEGRGRISVAKFEGMPQNNNGFGSKKVKLKFDFNAHINNSADIEVFFLRDGEKHPGNEGKPIFERTPNWFHYWKQVAEIDDITVDNLHFVYSLMLPAHVPAMTLWQYPDPVNPIMNLDKTRVEMGDIIPTFGIGRAFDAGAVYSGIDHYMAIVIHENRHVEQIAERDALLSGAEYAWPDVQRYFANGWSFNVSNHNHWALGPKGMWGDPPGAQGSENANLSHPLSPNWPASLPPPTPNLLEGTIHQYIWHESDAINATEAAMGEDHIYAEQDWGAPGKQWRELNVWN